MSPKSEKDLFKFLCFTPDPKWRALRLARRSWLEKQRLAVLWNLWSFRNWKTGRATDCRHCAQTVKENEFTIIYGYWNAGWYCCHKDCFNKGTSEEAIECQIIDADCNDCKFFKRGEMIVKGIFSGWCAKLQKNTLANVKHWTGKECFEHRRL